MDYIPPFGAEIISKLNNLESLLNRQRPDAEQLFFFLKDQVESLQKTLDAEHEVCLTEATSRFDVHVVILENDSLILKNEFDGHETKLLAMPQYCKFLMSVQKTEHPKRLGFISC